MSPTLTDANPVVADGLAALESRRSTAETFGIPLAVLAELTHRCPLQCPYCSNPVELDRGASELTTEEWKKVSRPAVEQTVNKRVLELSARLNGHAFLEGGFTAADLVMSQVLRLLRHTSLVAEIPTLHAYCRRCEARPAFQKALADQLAAYAANAPAMA